MKLIYIFLNLNSKISFYLQVKKNGKDTSTIINEITKVKLLGAILSLKFTLLLDNYVFSYNLN